MLVGMGLLVAACGGGHGAAKPSASASPPGPADGQAEVVATVAGDTPAGQALAADPRTSGGPLGASTGTDGSLYLSLPGSVVRLAQKGRASTVATGTGSATPRGVVTLPDDSFVTVRDGQLIRLGANQPTMTLAGVKGAFRPLSAPIPSGGTATSLHLTADAMPIGVLGDGSVVVADGDALWRVLRGKLTLLYRHAAVKTAGGALRPSVTAAGSAVAPTGTIYLLPAAGAADTVADIETISPAGAAKPLAVPSSAAGVPGAPGTLTPLWLSSDGRSGLYVHATRGTHGDYVLHISGGKAEVLLASTTGGTLDGCSATKPVAATAFPCPLPRTLIVQPGLLVLAGGEPYVVAVKPASS
jgi:hypothetical protein